MKVRERIPLMFEVEDIQNYGKEHFETAVAHATGLQDGKSFAEKLSGVKSLDKALEAQSEYAKTAYETFVADAQKIANLYGDLAKQAIKPLEGAVAKFAPGAAH
jgi:hypothetical protein